MSKNQDLKGLWGQFDGNEAPKGATILSPWCTSFSWQQWYAIINPKEKKCRTLYNVWMIV